MCHFWSIGRFVVRLSSFINWTLHILSPHLCSYCYMCVFVYCVTDIQVIFECRIRFNRTKRYKMIHNPSMYCHFGKCFVNIKIHFLQSFEMMAFSLQRIQCTTFRIDGEFKWWKLQYKKQLWNEGKYELSTYHNLRHSTTKLLNTYRFFAIRSILWNDIRKRMSNQLCNQLALYSLYSFTNNRKRKEKRKSKPTNIAKTANSKRSVKRIYLQ